MYLYFYICRSAYNSREKFHTPYLLHCDFLYHDVIVHISNCIRVSGTYDCYFVYLLRSVFATPKSCSLVETYFIHYYFTYLYTFGCLSDPVQAEC
jgi:hypothetical protein